MTGCAEHLSCRTPMLTTRNTRVVTRRSPLYRHTMVELYHGPDYLGAIRDDGFTAHPSHGGGWRTRWSAFAGGSAVFLPDTAERDPDPAAALDELRRYCDTAAFHMRMAMHG